MPKSTILTVAAAAAFLAASPALAQPPQAGAPPAPAKVRYGVHASGPMAGQSGPQTSTPAEQAETEKLNRELGGGVYVSPGVLNGTQPGGLSRADAESRKRAEAYRARMEAHQKAVDHYQAEMQRHRAAEDSYRAAKKRYDADMRRYRERWPDAAKNTNP